jgi:hypothetical protein
MKQFCFPKKEVVMTDKFLDMVEKVNTPRSIRPEVEAFKAEKKAAGEEAIFYCEFCCQEIDEAKIQWVDQLNPPHGLLVACKSCAQDLEDKIQLT